MSEPAFIGAGQSAGLELWRVENLQVVKQPQANGKFHTGDSYILLATTANPRSGALSWAVHFWLGTESTQDETGIAAYKTIELDDMLGGRAVQYREVQGHESALFLSYFKSSGGIHYLPGGVDAGFVHVERDQYPTRLLHLKGKRTVRCNEVPLALSSLNNGDVFLLDQGLTLFLFSGANANRYEKAKGIEVATRLNDEERGGRGTIVLLEDDPQNAEFWAHFGGYTTSLPAGEEDSDDVPLTTPGITKKLFRISNNSGEMRFDDITPSDGKLKKEMLDTNDVFLVQSPGNAAMASSKPKLFVWIGKKSNLEEKKEATIVATKQLAISGLPSTTVIERVSEGMENAAFKAEFMWDSPTARLFGPKSTGIAKSSPSQTEEDISKEVERVLARKAHEDAPLDDGKSKPPSVWLVKGEEKIPIDVAHHGQFYSGECYIIHHAYRRPGRFMEDHMIYFWLGLDSTPDQKGYAAVLTSKLDDSLGGKAVQVRVAQSKEPGHFRHLFQGKMVIYRGHHGETCAAGSSMLFHVRGSCATDTCARQVPAQASSLNSQDAFILVSADQHQVFVWNGKHSNEDERNFAMSRATDVFAVTRPGSLVVSVNEHAEPADFWAALGGAGEYLDVIHPCPRDPRLFSASNAAGRFRVEEVENFDQSDLNDEDVYLLDTFTQLFVWIGSQSNQEEKKKSMEFAEKFVTMVNDGRDADIPIIRINAGEEPYMFTNHFVGWDPKFTEQRKFVDPYQAKLEALRNKTR